MNRRTFAAGVLATAAVTPAAVDLVMRRVDASPSSAASVNKLQDAVTALSRTTVGPNRLNLASYAGADPSGATASDTALQNAIADAKASNASWEIWLPGRFLFTSRVNLDQAAGIALIGAEGSVQSAGPGSMAFAGTGSGSFISARSTQGVQFRNLFVYNNNSGFTGILVDCSHLTGYDSTQLLFENCYFGGTSGATGGAVALSVDKTISSRIVNCTFSYIGLGIRGAAASGSYCNAITVDGCVFLSGMVTMPIQDLGQGCVVRGCTFEGLSNGKAGAYLQRAIYSAGLTIEECWFGDVGSAAASNWLQLSGQGLRVMGNYISGSGKTTAINIMGNSSAVDILGNIFQTHANAVVVGNNVVGFLLSPSNYYNTVTTILSGTPAEGIAFDTHSNPRYYGAAPSAGAGADNGTSPPPPVVNGNSNSSRGYITFGSGTGPAAGAQVTVTYANGGFPLASGGLTYPVLIPLNAATAALGLYVSAASNTGFTVATQNVPAASQGNTVFAFMYLVGA